MKKKYASKKYFLTFIKDHHHQNGFSTSGSISIRKAVNYPTEIPVPIAREVESVAPANASAPFKPPHYYIKYTGPSIDEEWERVEYDMEEEDEPIVKMLKLSPDDFEMFIDRMEKINGFRPQLVSYKELKSIIEEGQHRFARPDALLTRLYQEQPTVLKRLYDYWRQKRLKRRYAERPVISTNNAKLDSALLNIKRKEYYPNCGMPLIQQYETQPEMEDLNPYVAFRPREKTQPRKVYNIIVFNNWIRIDFVKQNV